jgi:hypothetical protein
VNKVEDYFFLHSARELGKWNDHYVLATEHAAESLSNDAFLVWEEAKNYYTLAHWRQSFTDQKAFEDVLKYFVHHGFFYVFQTWNIEEMENLYIFAHGYTLVNREDGAETLSEREYAYFKRAEGLKNVKEIIEEPTKENIKEFQLFAKHFMKMGLWSFMSYPMLKRQDDRFIPCGNALDYNPQNDAVAIEVAGFEISIPLAVYMLWARLSPRIDEKGLVTTYQNETACSEEDARAAVETFLPVLMELNLAQKS